MNQARCTELSMENSTGRSGTRGCWAGIAVWLLACLATRSAAATDYIWIIGGGSNLENSQAQIEKNVLWAREVLLDAPGERVVRIYFTDGAAPTKDVKEWIQPAESKESLQPLARIYDTYIINGERYRNHRIPGVAGPATALAVQAALAADFSRMVPGDRGLLIYNGHGQNDGGKSGSSLSLWGGTSLHPNDLERLLAELKPGITMRFVFTQCYSGGFASLALPGERTSEPAQGARCGFMSVASDQEAEGCSAALDANDYRDYSTYFFAALRGRNRLDGELEVDPDRNGDGLSDPYEAHLYALQVARSMDLPRSTSEEYLLSWRPWYTRLWPVSPTADNVYHEIVAELAKSAGLHGGATEIRRQVRDQRRRIREQMHGERGRQGVLRRAIRISRNLIRHQLEARWPEAGTGHTRAYLGFLEDHLDKAQDFILGHRLYQGLVENQDQYWVLERAILDLQRQLARMDRIEHLMMLGETLDALRQRGSATDQAAYRGLLACERQPL